MERKTFEKRLFNTLFKLLLSARIKLTYETKDSLNFFHINCEYHACMAILKKVCVNDTVLQYVLSRKQRCLFDMVKPHDAHFGY